MTIRQMAASAERTETTALGFALGRHEHRAGACSNGSWRSPRTILARRPGSCDATTSSSALFGYPSILIQPMSRLWWVRVIRSIRFRLLRSCATRSRSRTWRSALIPDTGLVALPSWFWIDGYDGTPITASESLGGVTVEVEITAQAVPLGLRRWRHAGDALPRPAIPS